MVRSAVVVSDERREVELGEIVLRPSAEELGEVEVTAEREYVEAGADMTTYHPQRQPVLAGGSVQSVLENNPSMLSSAAVGFQARASLTAEVGWGVTLQTSQYFRSPMDVPSGRQDVRTREHTNT